MDMAMPQYQPDSLDNTSDGGHGGSHATHSHEAGGIGDTGMYALIKIFDRPNQHIHATLGFTAPTGDVGIKLKEGSKNLDGANIHYGMQLGSGTWDFKPSVTYTGKSEAWSWGAQVGGTKRIEGKNKSGYVLGDLFETSVWGGYNLTNWLSTTVRAAYTWQGRIQGKYPNRFNNDYTGDCLVVDYTYADDLNEDGIEDGPPYLHQTDYNQCLTDSKLASRAENDGDRPSPMDFPQNYGGQYVDFGIGLSATVPRGAFAGNKLSFEWLQPVYTDVNGYQLDRDGALSFNWSYGF